ncbi:hypothetical protein [Microbulbifer yueqingensis]|uniref:hypothetical protein n=1 Tax=Microbulbifer yueqingensis TaxID=658219 RepID=UPI000B8279DA|nr:hypothetical protein [Microbulbifer yueqingensis]
MVASNSPSSSATRSAVLAGGSSGALLPPPGLPELAELLALCAVALRLVAEVLAASLWLDALALLDELLALEEELLDDEEAVCSSSEKSTSSGGFPSLPLDGSGGIRRSCGSLSASLYTGVD